MKISVVNVDFMFIKKYHKSKLFCKSLVYIAKVSKITPPIS